MSGFKTVKPIAGATKWRAHAGTVIFHRRGMAGLAAYPIQTRPGRHRIKARPVWFNPKA